MFLIPQFNTVIILFQVHVAPSFNESENHRNIEVVEGETVDVTCHASGKPPPTYTWIKSNRKANLGTIGDRFSVNDQTGTIIIVLVLLVLFLYTIFF